MIDRGRFPPALLAGALFALVSLLGRDASAAKQPAGSDSAPKLLSTTGGGAPKSKWGSIDEIKRAAEKGDPDASNEYAIILEQGKLAPPDFNRALGFYEAAAKAGNKQSAFRLATIYHDGLGVKQDYATAFSYYKQAAYAGDSLAQYNVGSMLVSARGMKRDWVEGLAWVIVATQNGADPEGEKRIRDQLASRKPTIAAAEQRAVKLREEIKSGRGPGLSEPVSSPVKPTLSVPAAPAVPVERPQVPVMAPPPIRVPGALPGSPPAGTGER